MGDINVVNPGLVNVADQADGLTVVEQTITVSPAQSSGPTTEGGTLKPGLGVETNSPCTRSDPMTAQRTVEGGTASPVSPNQLDTTENTVIGQPESVQQYNHTQNVFV